MAWRWRGGHQPQHLQLPLGQPCAFQAASCGPVPPPGREIGAAPSWANTVRAASSSMAAAFVPQRPAANPTSTCTRAASGAPPAPARPAGAARDQGGAGVALSEQHRPRACPPPRVGAGVSVLGDLGPPPAAACSLDVADGEHDLDLGGEQLGLPEPVGGLGACGGSRWRRVGPALDQPQQRQSRLRLAAPAAGSLQASSAAGKVPRTWQTSASR